MSRKVIASRAARYWSISIASAVVLAGCGSTWQPKFESNGYGKDQYWVVRSHGKAKAVVVLLHGLGQDSGEQLEPWQAHLADEGYDVIYPRYEQPPPDTQARNNIVGAVGRALGDLGRPKVPLVLLGHSRGGRLAVEAAAFLKPRDLIVCAWICVTGTLKFSSRVAISTAPELPTLVSLSPTKSQMSVVSGISLKFVGGSICMLIWPG